MGNVFRSTSPPLFDSLPDEILSIIFTHFSCASLHEIFDILRVNHRFLHLLPPQVTSVDFGKSHPSAQELKRLFTRFPRIHELRPFQMLAPLSWLPVLHSHCAELTSLHTDSIRFACTMHYLERLVLLRDLTSSREIQQLHENCPYLKRLCFEDSAGHHELKSSIWDLAGIHWTELVSLELSHSPPLSYAWFPGLRALNLSFIHLDPLQCQIIGQLRELRYLNLTGTGRNISEDILIPIWESNRYLTALDLSCYDLITDACIAQLVVHCPCLQVLRLMGCLRLTDRCLEHLRTLPQLHAICVNGKGMHITRNALEAMHVCVFSHHLLLDQDTDQVHVENSTLGPFCEVGQEPIWKEAKDASIWEI